MELTYIKPGATFAVGKKPNEMLHGMFNALFLTLRWRVIPVVSLPQELKAMARYDRLILTDPKLLPLPSYSMGSTEFGKAHHVYFCKHFDMQRVCLEKKQRRCRDIISGKVCKVVFKEIGIRGLS